MADYGAQAASIYDPQLQAEQGTLNAGHTANAASLDRESTTTQGAYAQALADAGKTRDAASANSDFVAQTHGLFNSGLAANAQRLVFSDYANNATKIETDRATKLADIAGRRTAEDQGYQANLGALSSKYQGMKNQYISSEQNAQAKADAANAARVQAASIRASSKAPTALQTKQAAYSSLADDAAGMLKGYGSVLANGATENVIAKLQNAYAGSGLSAKEVQDYIYQYRKSTYGS